MMRRQSGALLLMVALILATLAALSIGLNRAATADLRTVQEIYSARAAGYLADAAVATAKWTNQVAGCTNTSIARTTLGNGTFAATVTKAPSKKLNIVATGTAPGNTLRTLERKEVNLVDFSKTESRDLGGAELDTTVALLRWLPANSATELDLAESSFALLFWPVGEIKPDAQVLTAALILTQSSSGSTPRQVSVRRMMTAWDANAMWAQSRAFVGWTGRPNRLAGESGPGEGGDYAASPVATTTVAGATTYRWDVTGLVDGWASGRLVNYGMLLRLPPNGGAVSFYSDNAASSRRPVLRVVSAKTC